jgi:hypothetical protein
VKRPLPIREVLRDTWTLYCDLFGRTIVVAVAVFGVGYLVLVLVGSAGSGAVAALLALLMTAVPIAGTALVQGALVEAVDDAHGGRPAGSVRDLYRSAGARTGTVLWLSILTGLGVGLGLVFLVPGLVLLTRWSLAVPVAVLERLPARAAMRRSRELVRGHGWAVFRVLVNVGVITQVLALAVRLAVSHTFGPAHPLAAFAVGETLGSALTLPYAAHAMSVVYYRLTQPERPVLAPAAARWESVWAEHDRERAA